MNFLFLLAISSIIYLPGGIFRAEQVIFIVIFLIGVFKGRLQHVGLFSKEILIIFMMAFFGAISVANMLMGSQSFAWNDFFVVPKMAYYALIFISLSMLTLDEKNKKTFYRFITFNSMVIVGISVFQYFNLLHLNPFFVDLYRPGYTWLTEMDSWRRIIGTFGNPNYWGLLCSQLILVNYYYIAYEKKYSNIAIILGLFVAIIFTGSRTGLIVSVLGCVVGTMICFWRLKKVPNVFVVAVLCLTIFGGFIYVVKGAMYEDGGRFSLENTHTLGARVRHWGMIQETEGFNLFIGSGPDRSSKARWVDNSYIKILREFGIIHLLLYLTLLSTMLFRSVRQMNINHGFLSSMLVFLISSWMVFEIVADGWEFIKSATLFLALYCYSVAYFRDATPLNPPPIKPES